MSKMKKLLCIALSLALVLGALTACGENNQNNNPSSGNTNVNTPSDDRQGAGDEGQGNVPDDGQTSGALTLEDVYAGIEPLAEPVNLNLGYMTGSHHGMITQLINKFGGYEKVGINPNIETFGTGPVMVEAMRSDSWDCGTTGLGGVLMGVINDQMLVIGAAARDYGSLTIFAKNDSDIVAAGQTLADQPGVYGTADTWRGKEILVPTGSTLHYVLSTGLEKFGLSDTDVAMTHMDVTGVNTALRAGQGEIGAVWGSFAYSDLNEKFTPVMTANDLGIELPVVVVANPRSYADPVKYEAIKKYVELYYATIDWIYSSEENFAQTCEWFTEINEEAGAIGTVEENRAVLENDKHYSLQENVALFNEKSADGSMLRIEEMHYNPLMFYIQNGNYQSGDEVKLLGGYFKADIINELAAQAK